jgi:hypothetical protein
VAELGDLLKDLESAFPRAEVFCASRPSVQDVRDILEAMLDQGVDLPSRSLSLEATSGDMVVLYERTLRLVARL